MNNEDLCYLSATETLKLFKRRKLSPVELMQAIIKRTEKVEPVINAFTETFFDRAMDQARKSEARYMKKGARLRKLEGLPLAIKDELPVKGDPCTAGSLIYKDAIADETAVFAQRLLNAGAINHARTTTPEFCCAAVTTSRIWGTTRNPWNPNFTPGGSSGGSAASLAAGTSMLATGSDIGGSVRIPASCCGVVGFKPPYGRIPEMPVFNLDFYCHEGPLARTVSDTILMQNVVAGPHPTDITSIKPKLTIPSTFKSIRGWRIAYSLDLGYFKISKEVRENTLRAVEVYRSLGCKVEEVKVPWTEESGLAAWNYLSHLFGASYGPYLKKYGHLMTPYARAFIEGGVKSKSADFVNSLVTAADMYSWFGPMMENYDVFICPTTTKSGIAANPKMDYDSYKAAGKSMPDALSWCMTYPFNMLSRCPVLSVPSGHGKNGVPTGIQIVGRTFADTTVFRAASAFEKATPWLHDKKHRPVIKAKKKR
ncbi:MAG: amidase [Rhodospirillales bacterium]|jgi:Asp-tRNA(Asn)/Glu-tRNA(Gln) amidotransferase A subunit family amidase|nr:amidase [Rhodospirillales bacterium]